MDLSTDQVKHAVLYVIAFVVSVSVHEFGHAWMATRLGDRLPRAQGRVTLSPMAHIDPLGTLLLPLVGALAPPGSLPLIAWGKPVQTNPRDYTARWSRKVSEMLVAAVGPFMNFLLAVVTSLVFVALARAGVMSDGLAEGLLRYALALNITLMFFNMLPIPPLDGGTVLLGVLPRSASGAAAFLQKYGILILLAAVLIPGVMQTLMLPAAHLTRRWAGWLVSMSLGAA